MKVWKNSKGNRIRASDKSLVYHFCIDWLLLLFIAVFLLGKQICYRIFQLM